MRINKFDTEYIARNIGKNKNSKNTRSLLLEFPN